MSNIRVGDIVEVQTSPTVEDAVWVGLRFRVTRVPVEPRGLFSGAVVRVPAHPNFLLHTGVSVGVVVHFFPQDIRRVSGGFSRWYKEHS